eukprot:TRINITY_DN2512_c0_g1_i1.p1 TRINITY_DN2512_c0_g1~~TRINITY_DN2512_c0_g1_i1.p1  ORF type:complete len:172 (-),score=40.75 TRINITY_DN2512_c0_g1_i1:256-771(-)
MDHRTHAVPTIDLASFAGTWYIVRSNSSYWADRKNVSVHYVAHDDASKGFRYHDKVTYQEKGHFGSWKDGSMEGKDKQTAAPSGAFRWTGSGWLRFVTSEWAIIAVDPTYKWAIKYAAPTIATGDVIDIYSRNPSLDPESAKTIQHLLETDAFLQRCSVGMRDVVHDARSQ